MNCIKAKLNQQFISYNYQVYCQKGERVTIISRHENVYIVETREGVRFAVHQDKVDLFYELN
jgi:hypothetical protein